MSLSGDLAPLQGILDKILSRVEAIETKIAGGSSAAESDTSDDAAESPAIAAYDKHVSNALTPFLTTLKSLNGLGDSIVPSSLTKAWSCIRDIIETASKCKKPSSLTALGPMIKPAQDAIADIRKVRLSRDYDYHIKAMMEMLACLGWIMITATSEPPSPSIFVKNTIGSSDFWANKIRKQYKGKDDDVAKANILFCDSMKKLIMDLAAYTKEHHMSGLKWNMNGVELSDYTPESKPASSEAVPAKPVVTSAPTPKTKPSPLAGGIADIKAELAKKRSSAGNSAATGLKKVTKDQQTWRKEFKQDKSPTTASSSSSSIHTNKPVKAPTKKATPPPVFEYRDRGSKWVIEYQTKSTTDQSSGVITVNVTDSKQHVYIYKCEGVTFDIKGKSNSIILDSCSKSNVVFENVISSCEVVNCKKIQTQVKGVCPSFSIDKTDGFLTYLSKESASITNFVTCKSSEMNVNYPDDDGEMKELPIPEQFQHKLTGGALKSEVSDLYH